jgi:hypothetical protein
MGGRANKDEASDLTAQQKKALKVAIETELTARAARRRAQPHVLRMNYKDKR